MIDHKKMFMLFLIVGVIVALTCGLNYVLTLALNEVWRFLSCVWFCCALYLLIVYLLIKTGIWTLPKAK